MRISEDLFVILFRKIRNIACSNKTIFMIKLNSCSYLTPSNVLNKWTISKQSEKKGLDSIQVEIFSQNLFFTKQEKMNKSSGLRSQKVRCQMI